MENSTKYEKNKRGIWVPVVSVTIYGKNNRSFDFSMLIDSGSDGTVINLETGELLGFTSGSDNDKRIITGIGGSLTAFYKNVKLKLFDKEIQTDICWVLNNKVPLLIGRDIFDYFHITFKQDEKVTVFKWIK